MRARKLRLRVGDLRRALCESLGVDELSNIEVGDLVDVDLEYAGRVNRVRVVELVNDVNDAAGVMDHPTPGRDPFSGPGFVGVVEEDGPEYSAGEEAVFALDQVVPGSKSKYYFPQDL